MKFLFNHFHFVFVIAGDDDSDVFAFLVSYLDIDFVFLLEGLQFTLLVADQEAYDFPGDLEFHFVAAFVLRD